MRNPVNPLLAIGGLFVVGFLIFLLVGDESEKVYTRNALLFALAPRPGLPEPNRSAQA